MITDPRTLTIRPKFTGKPAGGTRTHTNDGTPGSERLKISGAFDAEDFEILSDLAAHNGISFAALVRHLVAHGLKAEAEKETA